MKIDGNPCKINKHPCKSDGNHAKSIKCAPFGSEKCWGTKNFCGGGRGKVKNTGGEPPGTPSLADRLRCWPKIERFAFNNNQNT